MAFSMDFGTGFEMGGSTIEEIADTYNGDDKIDVTTDEHTGTYALEWWGHNGLALMQWNTSGSPTDVYVGLWIKYTHDDAVNNIMIRAETDGTDLSLRADVATGGLYYDTYVGGSKVADGTIHLPDYVVYHHVQIRFHLADSGHIETRVEGLDDISYSGDTKQGGATEITAIVLDWASGNLYKAYIDDFAFGTGGWPGDIRFDALVPDGDDSVTWTGSDGNQVDNYALIDEVGPSDADYVRSTADAEQDKYDLADWDGTDKTPTTVILWARVKKDEAAAHLLKLILDDGTENVSAGHNLLTSFGYVHRLDETPPSGGAWDESTIDDLKVGVESEIV